MSRPVVADLFAGAGGASAGIFDALGVHPDVAVNHDETALAVHAVNHPSTRHLVEDVFDVNPRGVMGGRDVDLLWMSPDCTHHSRARGGKPRDRGRRSLASVAHRWAAEARPSVIILENVEEFLSWGPLGDDGQPIRERAGESFAEWRAVLEAHGYRIEHRTLVAADYGAPTTRRRLFLVARCDGLPIVWPEPTHGPGRARPWRAAAEIIDWTVPCHSIFGRAKPLAEATQARIAEGMRRYVIKSPHPFVVRLPDAMIAPTLIQTGYGERKGQTPRALDITRPLGTVVAGGAKHALVVAWLVKHYKGVFGHGLERPIGTITTQDHHSLATAELLPEGADRREEVLAFLTKFYGTSVGAQLDLPAPTVTAGGSHLGLVTVHGERRVIADIRIRMLTPRELARAQGFPDDYQIEIERGGKPLSKTVQTRLVGNSVPPHLAAAMVRANIGAPVEIARAA